MTSNLVAQGAGWEIWSGGGNFVVRLLCVTCGHRIASHPRPSGLWPHATYGGSCPACGCASATPPELAERNAAYTRLDALRAAHRYAKFLKKDKHENDKN